MKRILLLPTSVLILILTSCGLNSSNYIYEGPFPVEIMSSSGNYNYGSGNYQYMNLDGSVALASEDFTDAKGELPLFANDILYLPKEGRLGVNENSKYINKKGELLFKPSDYNAYKGSGFWENRAILESQNEYIIIDNKGKEIFRVESDQYSPRGLCKDGVFIFSNYNGTKWRIYDNNGKLLHEEENYQLATDYSYHGLICVIDPETRKRGALNTKGKLVIPCEFWGEMMFDRNGYAVAKNDDGEEGLIDKNGKFVLLPGEYKNITVDEDGLYKCLPIDANKYHWCDYKGKLQVKNKRLSFDDEMLFNRNGNLIVPINLPNKKVYFAVNMERPNKERLMLIDKNNGKDLFEEYNFFAKVEQFQSYYLNALDKYYKYGRPYTHGYYRLLN